MATDFRRIRIKRSTVAGEKPTVAPSDDHLDGTWDALDVYEGELFINIADGRIWLRDQNGIQEIGYQSDEVEASLTNLY